MSPELALLLKILATQKKMEARQQSHPNPWWEDYDWKDSVLSQLNALEVLYRQDFGDEAAEKWRDLRGLVNLCEGTMDELQKNLKGWS